MSTGSAELDPIQNAIIDAVFHARRQARKCNLDPLQRIKITLSYEAEYLLYSVHPDASSAIQYSINDVPPRISICGIMPTFTDLGPGRIAIVTFNDKR